MSNTPLIRKNNNKPIYIPSCDIRHIDQSTMVISYIGTQAGYNNPYRQFNNKSNYKLTIDQCDCIITTNIKHSIVDSEFNISTGEYNIDLMLTI